MGGSRCEIIELSKVCYRRQSFKDHLCKNYSMENDEEVRTKIEKCRIRRYFQERFWCGFCRKLVNLERKGLETWSERFDYIGDCFEKDGS